MLFFIRLVFALLAFCALILAWQFALFFSQVMVAGSFSLLLFTSLLFSATSVVAGMIAFHAMKKAAKLQPKQRLAYALAYVLVLLPSIVTLLALNHSTG